MRHGLSRALLPSKKIPRSVSLFLALSFIALRAVRARRGRFQLRSRRPLVRPALADGEQPGGVPGPDREEGERAFGGADQRNGLRAVQRRRLGRGDPHARDGALRREDRRDSERAALSKGPSPGSSPEGRGVPVLGDPDGTPSGRRKEAGALRFGVLGGRDRVSRKEPGEGHGAPLAERNRGDRNDGVGERGLRTAPRDVRRRRAGPHGLQRDLRLPLHGRASAGRDARGRVPFRPGSRRSTGGGRDSLSSPTSPA